MIALWMLYSVLIAAILGLAAALVDRTVTPTMRHRRWLWVTAVVLSVAMPLTVALAPSRQGAPANTSRVRQAPTGGMVESETSAVASRVAEVLARADSRVLESLDRVFVIGWSIAALLSFAAYGLATLSLARRRRTWRSTLVDGEVVLLAPGVGPAVVGALRPEIVVPEWSLDLAPEQRALMIEHERQHVRARDPLVLHAAAMVAMLTPWNLPLWWINRRLRLAVELDCDARVLAGGRDARAYGTLLLDVCSRRIRPSAVLAPALLERTSSLTRRILAIHPAPVRYARPRAALGAALAAGIVVLACDMPTPEMVAPDGTNAPTQRVFGKPGGVASLSGAPNVKAVVQQYFPAIARGEGEPSVLFVVRSQTGEILYTGAEPAKNLARSRNPQNGGAAVRQTARSRSDDRGSHPNARAALPAGIRAIDPNDIDGIEVSKHAEGVVAPKPVSLIVITLKAGAQVPAQPAGQ